MGAVKGRELAKYDTDGSRQRLKAANVVGLFAILFGLLVLVLTYIASSVSSYTGGLILQGYNWASVISAVAIVLGFIIISLANRASKQDYS